MNQDLKSKEVEASSEQIDKRDFSYVDPAFGITSKLSINAELQK